MSRQAFVASILTSAMWSVSSGAIGEDAEGTLIHKGRPNVRSQLGEIQQSNNYQKEMAL